MARDYVSSKAPRKKGGAKGGGKPEPQAGRYIKIGLALLLIVAALSGFFYLKFNGKQPEKKPAQTARTDSEQAAARKPAKDPYNYRKLLENSEVKTGIADQKRRNEKNYETGKRPEVILDPKKKKETREQEAARAQAILNGSLNTPREDVTHTVKVGSNDEIIFVDGREKAGDRARDQMTDRKYTSAEVESGRVSGVQAGASSKPVAGQIKPVAADARSAAAGNGAAGTKGNSAKASDSSRVSSAARAGVAKPASSASQASAASRPKETLKEDARTKDTSKDTAKPGAGAERFYAQCGAFRAASQADTLRKKIVAKGQPGSVSKAVVNSVDWYRVIVGPFSSKSIAQDVVTKLKSSGTVSNCNLYRK